MATAVVVVGGAAWRRCWDGLLSSSFQSLRRVKLKMIPLDAPDDDHPA